MWTKFSAFLGIAIGLYLIVFRRSFIAKAFQKQIRISTKRNKESLAQLREEGLEGLVYKSAEVSVLIIGVIIILMQIPSFYPQSQKYVFNFLLFGFTTFVAVMCAIVVEFTLLRKFLFKSLDEYNQDETIHKKNIQNSERRKEICDKNVEKAHVPVLNVLQRRRAIICFVVLFSLFLFCFLSIVIVTKGRA